MAKKTMYCENEKAKCKTEEFEKMQITPYTLKYGGESAEESEARVNQALKAKRKQKAVAKNSDGAAVEVEVGAAGAITGTKEWAVETVNFITGCSHDCRYCYGRHMAVDRFKRVTPEEWSQPCVREAEVCKKRHRVDGTVMTPSTHDICPEFINETIVVLDKLIDAGNDILLVSKPHIECIEKICARYTENREQIRFRFTIGCNNNELLAYWEPGAPSHEERLACLKYAYEHGFSTSVSVEPMLDGEHIVEHVERLLPWISDSVWIGKMNCIRSRVRIENEVDESMVEAIEAGQTDERIMQIYDALKNIPKIRWKESVKKVVGLKLADKPGLDI